MQKSRTTPDLEIDREWLSFVENFKAVEPTYDNPNIVVYLHDLRYIVKDDSETYQNQQWARGILTKFMKNELRREDFLLICRRLDQI